MAEASPQIDEPDPKRRKLRKGTQSCWECKKRKVRCIFETTSDVCENCMRRRTACVGQDLPDRPSTSTPSNPVEARLERVEELIEHVIDQLATIHVPNTTHTDVPDETDPRYGRPSRAPVDVYKGSESRQPDTPLERTWHDRPTVPVSYTHLTLPTKRIV